MLSSDNITVESCSFSSKKRIVVKGDFKDGEMTRGFSLDNDDTAHPDLFKERVKLGGIVATVLEFDEDTQKKCVVSKLKINRKTGEFDIEVDVQIPGFSPAPKIIVKRFNDITRSDAEPLLSEAAMYISGEKKAQSALEFA